MLNRQYLLFYTMNKLGLSHLFHLIVSYANYLIIDIVNNYPVTKNKPINHTRISKQMKGRAFSEPFHLLTVRA